jgi:hypothetical protein
LKMTADLFRGMIVHLPNGVDAVSIAASTSKYLQKSLAPQSSFGGWALTACQPPALISLAFQSGSSI